MSRVEYVEPDPNIVTIIENALNEVEQNGNWEEALTLMLMESGVGYVELPEGIIVDRTNDQWRFSLDQGDDEWVMYEPNENGEWRELNITNLEVLRLGGTHFTVSNEPERPLDENHVKSSLSDGLFDGPYNTLPQNQQEQIDQLHGLFQLACDPHLPPGITNQAFLDQVSQIIANVGGAP